MKSDLSSLRLAALLSLCLGATGGLADSLSARTAYAADSAQLRSRIVESSLKDLSTANDAAIARQQLTPKPGRDALGNPRVVLQPELPVDTTTAVRTDVQSSLHRLRRETVSRQTMDDRKAKIDENLARTARETP